MQSTQTSKTFVHTLIKHLNYVYASAAIVLIVACGGSQTPSSAVSNAASISTTSSSLSKTLAVAPQKIAATSLVDGIYTFKNACNGKLLGLQNGNPSPWDNAVLRDASESYISWQVKAHGDGSFALLAPGTQSALQTVYSALISETNADLWTYSGGATQRWVASDAANGTVKLALAAETGMALDAKYGGANGETNVWLYADNGSCAQRWTIEAVGGGAAPDAFAMQKQLGRGINFGNMLEASPTEGSWGLSLSDELFNKAKEANFSTIRLPVRWSNYAQTQAPFTINETFFKRVDYAIDAATSRGMNIVVNMHHHRQLCGENLDSGEPNVDASMLDDRFVAMWSQIAARYNDRPKNQVLFELYNEPNTACTPQRWNDLLKRAHEAVRNTNPDRIIIIGPTSWNGADALKDLVLPDDKNIIVTIHNYNPFKFTHQGASWAGGDANSWLGTTCCDAVQTSEMTAPLNTAQQWAGTRWPIWLGEFGSYENAPYDSRVRYTRTMRDEAEKRGLTWAYWEMASSFGIWDPNAKAWRNELKDALIGP